MGRRGPLPRRRDGNGEPIDSSAVAVVPTQSGQAATLRDVPPVPAGLLAETRQTWRDYWMSGAATWADRGAHMERLRRWILDVDLSNRIRRDLMPSEGKRLRAVPGVIDPRRPWLGKGSTGQIVAHPSASLLDQVDARLHRAEVEFGMSPYAGVRLGLAGVQGALTAEELARLIDERARHAPDDSSADWAEGFAAVPAGARQVGPE